MHKASASNRSLNTRSFRQPQYLLVQGMLTCVLSAIIAVGPAAVSFAEDAGEERDQGSLTLNSDVIVNESVGTATTGDFAVRGKLFSDALSSRADVLNEAVTQRLDITEKLSFAPAETAVDEYRDLRETLFDGYTPQVIPVATATAEEPRLLYALLLVIAAPLMLWAGVQAGKAWARRKRAAA